MGSLIQKISSGCIRFFFKHLYTTVAWAYDFVAWSTSMGQWRLWHQAALIEYEPGQLLEIGHGPGHLLYELYARNRDIYGVDASRQMTRIARDRFRINDRPSIAVHALAQALPFPAKAFSGVIATFPSEYIFEPASLQSIHRVLQPNGTLVIIIGAEITGKALFDRFSAWLFRVTGQSSHPEEAYSPWLDLLKSHGYQSRLEIVCQERARVLRLIAVRSQVTNDL